MQTLLEKQTVIYICPVCGECLKLQQSGKSYACSKQHSFDMSKEGYLNLLPVQYKHSKEPGDSKYMMIARREFLEAGFYEPMSKAVAMMIIANLPKGQDMRLLDLGCVKALHT